MKREGRQHGVVATHPVVLPPFNPHPNRRVVNKVDSTHTAGIFTKVSQKPTNHSKYTSRCGRSKCGCCHAHPATKAKDKTKGTQKLRSNDVVTNYRLVTCRVVDGKPGLSLSGFSASGILDGLDNYEDHVFDDDHDDDINDNDDDVDDGSAGQTTWMVDQVQEITGLTGPCARTLDDEEMSFCNVGIVLEQVDGDEGGWCLVQEL